jgi:hypothetical protein
MGIFVGIVSLIFLNSSLALGLFFLIFCTILLVLYHYSKKFMSKSKSTTCPKCLNDTMLPVEHDIAQKIIKDNQLNVEEIIREDIAIKEQKARYPWQTS